MSIKLRELIRNVRACKTAAEERAVIAKECALIRTAFKSTDSEQQFRHRNVAKLLYIHMLGYPTHFGQMESLKLIASPSFPEKRIGYLGLMILLDENVQVLMLVTNSLKNDFTNPNPYIVGLALCSLGNISSPDMARDLSNEVEKFFRSPNAYIRKKAALCAIRIIRKVPELIDDFIQSVQSLLNDKNHAVLLTAVALIIEIIKIDPKQVNTFRKCVPTIVRLLKNLSVAGYVSEYDVVGITDPFLQVKCIQLLRLLGEGHQETSEFMNDVLAHVAINTEPTKNPGNAILYECVMTIMSIEAEAGLRVLAINILGRFLQNRDNNIRYVALNTLCKVVNRDTQAIQRHRNTVVDCLKDADISIRRRALDLIYALVTKNNVKALVKELLNYLALTSGDVEFKADLTEKICLVVEKFAPNKHWHIDTLIAVLATAGNLTRESVATDLILLVTRSKTLHAYSAHKLYQALYKKTKVAQLPLMHVATWCIGEYGDLLISDDGLAKALEVDPKGEFTKLSESQILDLLQKVMKSPIAQLVTREYALNALIKLAGRFTIETDRLRKLIGTYRTSMSVELQQRSCEYTSLYSDTFTSLRSGIVARMPVLDKSKSKKKSGEEEENLKPLSSKVQSPSAARDETSDEEDDEPSEDDDEAAEDDEDAETVAANTAIPTGNGVVKKQPPPTASTDIFNLDIFGDSVAPTPASGGANGNGTTSTAAPTNSLDSFLSDVFGGSSAPAPVSSVPVATSLTSSFFDTPTPVPNSTATSNPLDFFGAPIATPTPAPVASSFPPVVVFESKGLRVTFNYNRNPATPETLQVIASFHNSTPQDFTNFDFQVAVLKNVQLKMEQPTSTTIPANGAGNVTQTLTLHNTLHGKKKLLIRVKIDYRVGGQPVTEQAQISQFPD